ncbi:oleosin 16 kDa-like [Panicum miliaceum]|uniref:Oleosin n=1 Tax=Panicum miliaceum TaxID=4540 RepID=A0A3L6TPW1_PANMI|nr:oleosin 16 kDa-like [Panicum miliaceum]
MTTVGEHYMRGLYGDDDYPGHHGQQQSGGAKALAAGTAAFSMLLLSGLALTATVLALIVATPLLVIFSPVLVPAAITVALLTVGFVSSGGFGTAAVGVLAWMYRYLKTPEQQQLSSKAWAHQRLEQARAH